MKKMENQAPILKCNFPIRVLIFYKSSEKQLKSPDYVNFKGLKGFQGSKRSKMTIQVENGLFWAIFGVLGEIIEKKVFIIFITLVYYWEHIKLCKK